MKPASPLVPNVVRTSATALRSLIVIGKPASQPAGVLSRLDKSTARALRFTKRRCGIDQWAGLGNARQSCIYQI
jgi:hypothetical protein